MKKKLNMYGLTSGEDMRLLIGILPDTKDKFTQRKQYDEYYPNINEYERVFTLEELEKLSEEFSITIGYSEITIN